MRSADLRSLADEASRAQREGDPLRAAEALERLCKLAPKNPQSRKALARAYQELGRPLEAVAALVRAAHLYAAEGEGIQAIAVCKWILELDPMHTTTLDRLAELQEGAGLPEPVVARSPGPVSSSRPSKAPIEEVMLRDVVEPASLPDDEGQRAIPIEGQREPESDSESQAESEAKNAIDGAPTNTGQRKEAARGLVSTPLFGQLGARALRRLIEATRRVQLREGEVLFRQGDRADALYVVVEGAVVPIAEDGIRRRLSVLEPGEFFGEIALVTDEPRNATIEALVESELLAIDRKVIGAMLQDEPEVLAVTLRFLRERLVARLLGTSPVFQGIRREEREQLIGAFRLMEVQEGAVLVEEGAPARALYLVLAGEVRVIEEHRDFDKEIAVLHAGDPCGEMSLLDGTPAIASAVAARKSWLLLLPRAEFARVLSQHPRLGGRLAFIADARRRGR